MKAMSGGDKDKPNPESFLDDTILDGTYADSIVAGISGWFGEKASDAKEGALGMIGMKDTDGDGKKDFSITGALGLDGNGSSSDGGFDWSLLAKGGIGTLVFGLLNKFTDMSWFKSIAISALLVFGVPKLVSLFNSAADNNTSPKTELVVSSENNEIQYPTPEELASDENNLVQSTAEKNKVNLTLKTPEIEPT